MHRRSGRTVVRKKAPGAREPAGAENRNNEVRTAPAGMLQVPPGSEIGRLCKTET
eukprot:CAMPEP_0115614932 /NCGR_PEP_ID=MMETSP0272-20121206/22364_1 /TAXON_ID=71861 /ORGANISM="Scrippsiella trochoidea, Strain CCMP3099" /LENGTH=54 /DNA_ID=CAMNT_0003050833 /DNA_START=275 /DNA_END=439 /DNA_ORIENTATION=-